MVFVFASLCDVLSTSKRSRDGRHWAELSFIWAKQMRLSVRRNRQGIVSIETERILVRNR